MNKAKLSALCAKAMGYTIIDNLHVKDVNGNWVVDGSDYNPIDDANQADDLFEYAADGRWWQVQYDNESRMYQVRIRWIFADAETQNLAKILCSLRASDKVTDAEIEEALK